MFSFVGVELLEALFHDDFVSDLMENERNIEVLCWRAIIQVPAIQHNDNSGNLH